MISTRSSLKREQSDSSIGAGSSKQAKVKATTPSQLANPAIGPAALPHFTAEQSASTGSAKSSLKSQSVSGETINEEKSIEECDKKRVVEPNAIDYYMDVSFKSDLPEMGKKNIRIHVLDVAKYPILPIGRISFKKLITTILYVKGKHVEAEKQLRQECGGAHWLRAHWEFLDTSFTIWAKQPVVVVEFNSKHVREEESMAVETEVEYRVIGGLSGDWTPISLSRWGQEVVKDPNVIEQYVMHEFVIWLRADMWKTVYDLGKGT